jgi:hypothetical protein
MRHPSASRRPLVALVLTSFACPSLLALPVARADDFSWVVGNGVWTNPDNWSPPAVPKEADTVYIGTTVDAHSAIINLSAPTAVYYMLVLSGMGVATSGGSLHVGGPLAVADVYVEDGVAQPSVVIVDDGPALNDLEVGSAEITGGGRLSVFGGRMYSNGQVYVGAESLLLARGTIVLAGDVTPSLSMQGTLRVAAGDLTLLQQGLGRIDLDGAFAGDHAIDVDEQSTLPPKSASLTIVGTGLTDAVDDDILLASGSMLKFDLDEGWALGAVASLRLTGDAVSEGDAIVAGAPLALHGTLQSSGPSSRLAVDAPTTVMPTANLELTDGGDMTLTGATVLGGDATVGGGSILRFEGTTRLEGGAFDAASNGVVEMAGPSIYDGEVAFVGAAEHLGDVWVVGPTTIDAEKFDMDGAGPVTWSIEHQLLLKAETLDPDDGAVHAAIDVSEALLGKLTVELPAVNDAWTMKGPLHLGGLPGLTLTRLAGNPFYLYGTMSITNAVAIAAETHFAKNSVTAFQTPTSRLRMTKTSYVADDAIFFGGGSLELAGDALHFVANGADFGATELVVEGHLVQNDFISLTSGVAWVDRITFKLGATWTVGIAGLDAIAEHTQIVAFGTTQHLAGAIDVLLQSGDGAFEPQPGDTFTILIAPPGSIVGAFDPNPVSHLPGKTFHWAIDYVASEVGDLVNLRLVDSVSCAADLNGDGTVDAADLAILLGEWGRCADCIADLDADGHVGGADVAILLGAWGACG